MTTCTERELLERIVRAHEVEDWLDLRREIDAFLAAPPACDAEKAVLLTALEDARMLCMNDHAYDNETSQVFEAVQVINRALADRPPAAAALLAQGEEAKRLRTALEEAKAVLGPRAAAMYIIRAVLAPGEDDRFDG